MPNKECICLQRIKLEPALPMEASVLSGNDILVIVFAGYIVISSIVVIVLNVGIYFGCRKKKNKFQRINCLTQLATSPIQNKSQISYNQLK